MPHYLVCNYLPDNFDPSTVTETMMEEIHALNRELIATGARKFACGIAPPANAKTVRKQPDGRVLVTDGPYTETKEHMGGFLDSGSRQSERRHLAGRRRLPLPAMSPARCASFFSTRLRRMERNSLARPDFRKHIAVTLERVSKTCFGPGHGLSRAEKCRNHKGF